MDAEINGGLFLFFSCPHQRDGAGAELSGVGAGHVQQPFVKPSVSFFHPALKGEMGWSAGVVTRQGPSSLAW
ncbi:hypothetical protein ABZ557_31350 [Streptomyces sp. NPDC019645]|uniref:hypothetical protein n=1 Tax=Streptomyces sp. NPDC019645 TaxID=3154786 RepID=UPI0033DA0C67